jgi:hypothetical protein
VPNALDTFRAQQEAASQLLARLNDVSQLLNHLRREVDGLTHDKTLQTLLEKEQAWLERTQQTVAEVRAWRDEERRRWWPGVMTRWIIAVVFALASAALAGAGYVWAIKPYASEIATCQARAEFGNAIERRILTMTAAERRQFDSLMKLRNGQPR